MKVKTTAPISIDDILIHLGTNTNLLNLGHYRNAYGILQLVLENDLTNIVELHCPDAGLTKMLNNVFEDVQITCICDTFNFDHTTEQTDNITFIKDFSDNNLDLFDDKSLDMVYMHDHNLPYHEIHKTLTEWLPKVRDDGIICGKHVGMSVGNMTEQHHALYAFAEDNKLSIESINGTVFYCRNNPMPSEDRIRPIRMIDFSDELV